MKTTAGSSRFFKLWCSVTTPHQIITDTDPIRNGMSYKNIFYFKDYRHCAMTSLCFHFHQSCGSWWEG